VRIYVASSWRNEYQQGVVQRLRRDGHDVYDFKNPSPGNHGFHWSEIDDAWRQWTTTEFESALKNPIAVNGYFCDMDALMSADATVLVLPCGRSAHLEAGWAAGRGKTLIIFIPTLQEPELMYKMADLVTDDLEAIARFVKMEELKP